MDFVQRHYSRDRATLQENYTRSLYYLDGKLADGIIEENKKRRPWKASSADEIDERGHVAIEISENSLTERASILKSCITPRRIT